MCYKELQVFLFVLMNCVSSKKAAKRYVYFIVRPRDYESLDLVVTRRALQHIRASSCITVRISRRKLLRNKMRWLFVGEALVLRKAQRIMVFFVLSLTRSAAALSETDQPRFFFALKRLLDYVCLTSPPWVMLMRRLRFARRRA